MVGNLRLLESRPDRKRSPGLVVRATLVLAMTLVAASASGADWPTWRNTASNSGHSSETIVLPLTLSWHSVAPLVEENGAAVANGIAYMATVDGYLHAFTVNDGFAVAGFPVVTGQSFGTPAVDVVNGKVYVLAGGSQLFAFNLNGSLAWTAGVGGLGYNYNMGPVIEDGYVYLKAGGLLMKYNSSGALQWSSPTSGMNNQPSVMGAYVYSNTEAGQIRKYDKLTGGEIVGGGFPITTGASEAALTTVDNMIFHKADLLHTYRATDGAPLWSRPAGGNSTFYGSPAVAAGAVYVYGYDGIMYAFDEITGAPLAGFPSVQLNPGGDRNWGSPSVAGDKVFIGAGTSQRLKVLGAAGTASAGQVLDEHLTFSTDTQGFDLCSPVVSDGWVLIMLDGGGLYAFRSGTVTNPGVLSINGNATCTDSRSVVLTLARDSSVVSMILSEDPYFAGAVYEPFASPKNWTLSPGFGLKTVYAKYKDALGVESNVFSDDIDYQALCIGPALLEVQCPSDSAQVGVAYSSALVASNGTPPYRYSIIGTLPAGLTLDTSTGAITGTPTTAGTVAFSVMVVDAAPDTATTSCQIRVGRGIEGIDCSLAVASEPKLWPPNHKYRAISILGVTSPDSGAVVTITVTGITQDEPVNARGDGNACPDGVIVNGQASVRAERTGRPGIPGNGRVYVISFTATDDRGRECAGSVSVCVPHDQGQASACIDDGQKYNSLGPCDSGTQLRAEVTEVALTVGSATGSDATLEFSLPGETHVELGVFDVAGRRVASLENGLLAAGVYQRTWDMSGATKGVYFVRLRAGGLTLTRTVVRAR